MSTALWLCPGLFILAAVLAVLGIAKLDVRRVIAGGALASGGWLLAAWTNAEAEPREQLELVELSLRLIDSQTAAPIRQAIVEIVDEDASAAAMTYRLPTSIDRSAVVPAAESLRVGILVRIRVTGSLADQRLRPQGTREFVDQRVEIVAKGYRRWRGRLGKLLRWPATGPQAPVDIALTPH